MASKQSVLHMHIFKVEDCPGIFKGMIGHALTGQQELFKFITPSATPLPFIVLYLFSLNVSQVNVPLIEISREHLVLPVLVRYVGHLPQHLPVAHETGLLQGLAGEILHHGRTVGEISVENVVVLFGSGHGYVLADGQVQVDLPG